MYLCFSCFLCHALSVSIITQLNKHWHKCRRQIGWWNRTGYKLPQVFMLFLGSLNLLKVQFRHKAALKLSAYAHGLQLLTQAKLHRSNNRRMLFSHIAKWGRKVRTPSVELVKLWRDIRESVHFSNRVFTSLHSLIKEKQRNIRNSCIWQDRLKENQVLYCSHLTQWAAFSVAMNELLLLNLVEVQNSHSSYKLSWKFTWHVQPPSIPLLP